VDPPAQKRFGDHWFGRRLPVGRRSVGRQDEPAALTDQRRGTTAEPGTDAV